MTLILVLGETQEGITTLRLHLLYLPFNYLAILESQVMDHESFVFVSSLAHTHLKVTLVIDRLKGEIADL